MKPKIGTHVSFTKAQTLVHLIEGLPDEIQTFQVYLGCSRGGPERVLDSAFEIMEHKISPTSTMESKVGILLQCGLSSHDFQLPSSFCKSTCMVDDYLSGFHFSSHYWLVSLYMSYYFKNSLIE
jgi:hypothetical protein